MRTMIKRYDLAKDVSSSVYNFMLCICVCLHGYISFIFSSVFVYMHVCISFIFSAGSILFLVGPWQEVNERAGEKDFELQNFLQ